MFVYLFVQFLISLEKLPCICVCVSVCLCLFVCVASCMYVFFVFFACVTSCVCVYARAHVSMRVLFVCMRSFKWSVYHLSTIKCVYACMCTFK